MSSNPLDSGKSNEQLFAERSKRMWDAVALSQPDRVPLYLSAGYYLAEYAGVSHQAIQDDFEVGQSALEKFAQEFEPDATAGAWMPGASFAVGDRMTVWPGHGLPDSGSFQFVEHEFMKADEYDDFLHDPSDWAIRTYIPRAFSELEGLAALPPLGMWAYGYYNLSNLAFYASPPVQAAAKALAAGIQAAAEEGARLGESVGRMIALGFPPPFFAGSLIEAPFDFMSDTLRGMRGIMLDMLRQPDKLLAAQDKVHRIELEHAKIFTKVTGLKVAVLPLHRGSDGFMSLEQFEKFYWPGLKRLLVELIENDITPVVFWEGNWNKRLEYLRELPAGKIAGWFQKSDIFKVKEVLGDVMCIMGGMPNSYLTGGTVSQVREYTQRLCEEVGKGGGFIMSTAVAEMEGSKPELVRAWVDATREYGVY
jgi:hypothetical protein